MDVFCINDLEALATQTIRPVDARGALLIKAAIKRPGIFPQGKPVKALTNNPAETQASIAHLLPFIEIDGFLRNPYARSTTLETQHGMEDALHLIKQVKRSIREKRRALWVNAVRETFASACIWYIKNYRAHRGDTYKLGEQASLRITFLTITLMPRTWDWGVRKATAYRPSLTKISQKIGSRISGRNAKAG